MKHIYFLLAFLLVAQFTYAQATEDVAVELNAIPSVSPPQITLKWKMVTPVGTDTPYYVIWKKAKTSTSWGTSIVTLTIHDSMYVDNAVIVDSAYEYFVRAISSSLISDGYIYAGIKCPAIHNRGGNDYAG